MPWLLDTNVLSETRRPRPNQALIRFLSNVDLQDLLISTVTLTEIRFGISTVADETKRQDLTKWLEATIRPMFENRILQATEDILLEWRVLLEQGRKSGLTFSQPDLLIAATARWHGLTVVTRDESQFLRAGVPVRNPWADVAP